MKNRNSGTIFWITGLSGSGKSTIGEHLKAKLEKEYGKTVIIHGDDIREIFKFKSYTKNLYYDIVDIFDILYIVVREISSNNLIDFFF